ncbi:MAG: WD40/YVTN/BNR-like repeat-containing protein [Pyrinomonadaceae bacterium]
MNIKRNFGSKLNLLFAAAILCLANAGFLFAFETTTEPTTKFGDWSIVGPSGGDVRGVAIDPRDKDRLYISTLDGQIYTSGNGGVTWKLLVNLNRPRLVLDQLFVDSRDSKIIYASGNRFKDPGGFFKTTDGGATWKEAKELSGESIHSMTQSTLDPNVLLVGTINGVWISKNSGDSWTKISSSTMPVNVDSLEMDPRSLDTIYAGTWWRAYKTTDAGKNWRLIKDGMIDDSDVFAITVDTKNPDHVVASACSGIYESQNAGEKWSKIQGIPSQSRRTRDILQHPSRPGTIYAATTEGFWMTTDGGKTWAMTTQRNLEINSIAVHPDNPDKVFIATNNYGVMVSTDGGRNFRATNDNFTSRFTYSVTADLENPNRLYATTQNTATGGGFVFISNDGGTNWEQAKNLDVARVSPFALLQDKVNPNTIYLGTNVGMFRSLDRGINWTQILPPKVAKTPVRRTTRGRGRRTAVAKKPVTPVAPVAPATPGLIPALGEKVKVLTRTEDGKNGILAGTEKGIYRSYDLAKGWEKISFGEGLNDNVFTIAATPLQPETIWVGTATSGIIVSRDNGATWQKSVGVPENVPVNTIAIDPKSADNIYVGTIQTFYMSGNGGKSWTRRGGNLPLGNFTSILINPNNSKEIFVSSALESDGGIFYSDDAGGKWKRIDSKEMILPSRRVWAMAFDPTNPNRIFAGTHSAGVYRIERAVKQTAETPTQTDNISRPRVAEKTEN